MNVNSYISKIGCDAGTRRRYKYCAPSNNIYRPCISLVYEMMNYNTCEPTQNVGRYLKNATERI